MTRPSRGASDGTAKTSLLGRRQAAGKHDGTGGVTGRRNSKDLTATADASSPSPPHLLRETGPSPRAGRNLVDASPESSFKEDAAATAAAGRRSDNARGRRGGGEGCAASVRDERAGLATPRRRRPPRRSPPPSPSPLPWCGTPALRASPPRHGHTPRRAAGVGTAPTARRRERRDERRAEGAEEQQGHDGGGRRRDRDAPGAAGEQGVSS